MIIDNAKVVVSRNNNMYIPRGNSENPKQFAFLKSSFMDKTNSFKRRTLREIKEQSEKNMWMYGLVGEKKNTILRQSKQNKK